LKTHFDFQNDFDLVIFFIFILYFIFTMSNSMWIHYRHDSKKIKSTLQIKISAQKRSDKDFIAKKHNPQTVNPFSNLATGRAEV